MRRIGKMKIDKKAAKRVEQAIKRYKELSGSEEIEKKAEEIAKKYNVSKSDAMAYLRMQMHKMQRKEKLKHAQKILKKMMSDAQAFANRYEQLVNKEQMINRSQKETNKDQTGLTQYANNIMKYWK